MTLAREEPYLSVTAWCDENRLCHLLRELAANQDPDMVPWMDLADLLGWSFYIDDDQVTVGGLLADDEAYIEWCMIVSYRQMRQATRRWLHHPGLSAGPGQ